MLSAAINAAILLAFVYVGVVIVTVTAQSWMCR